MSDSENKEEKLTLTQKITKKVKGQIITALLVVLAFVGTKVWDWTVDGDEQEMVGVVKGVLQEQLQDPYTLHQVLKSPAVTEFTKESQEHIKKTIEAGILKDDSSRISIEALLGKETGLRDEMIAPLLAKIIKAFDAGEMMTKHQAEEMIDDQVKKILGRRNISADIP